MMFTGIVEEIGRVKMAGASKDGYQMSIEAGTVLENTRLGDSIAVNGVCLTVTRLTTEAFTVGVAPETLSKTNLGDSRPGDGVNLERALLPTSRMGGHIVQGHVDGTAVVRRMVRDGESLRVSLETSPEILKYIVVKGFVCVDGVSLTVVGVNTTEFDFMLVPFTQAHITLPRQKPGYRANIEVDVLGKYVEKLLASALAEKTAISAAYLKEHGF